MDTTDDESKPPKNFTCRRCGNPRPSWAMFCGAACCAAWEMGDRDPTAPGSWESKFRQQEDI